MFFIIIDFKPILKKKIIFIRIDMIDIIQDKWYSKGRKEVNNVSIRVETWGEYALFTRPEMKVERASYDVMTPSAARGILEAIFWHPGLKWQVDKIFVRAPIRFLNLRRNEVKATVNARSVKTVMNRGEGDLWISAPDEIQQRAALLLRDVRYIIEAHFDMTDPATRDNPGKFQDIMKRRIQKGQFYHQYDKCNSQLSD